MCAELSSTLSMYYMVDEAEQDLYIGVHAVNHDGWVGIGLNGNGGMRGASMVVVRQEREVWVAEGRYSHGYELRLMDQQQDVTLT
eukprot:2896311-Amphidinium_carterae.1